LRDSLEPRCTIAVLIRWSRAIKVLYFTFPAIAGFDPAIVQHISATMKADKAEFFLSEFGLVPRGI
jgi:hypothetical protein